MGQRHPNGRLIYLTKMGDHPFTIEKYGDKYSKPAEWHFSPNEIKRKERQMRANELKRQLEQKAEEVRVARMKELNVWLGDMNWRRPWQAKVEYFPADRTKKTAVSTQLTAEEASA